MTKRKKYCPEQQPSEELHSVARDGHVLWIDNETSQRMSGIRQAGTKPELVVRQLLSLLGHRYRVGNRGLPGSPDIANRRKRWAIFVHGCFWHRHSGCRLTTTPKRNLEFWEAKFARNMERDAQVQKELRDQGFRVLVVWECQTRKPPELSNTLHAWMTLGVDDRE